jgi:hypothetical protein
LTTLGIDTLIHWRFHEWLRARDLRRQLFYGFIPIIMRDAVGDHRSAPHEPTSSTREKYGDVVNPGRGHFPISELEVLSAENFSALRAAPAVRHCAGITA